MTSFIRNGVRSMVRKILSISFFILLILLFLRYLGIQNPVYFLSNDFVVQGYQATRSVKGNSEIMLVNIRDFPANIIKDQIEILSLYSPAVIGVDFFPETDSISQGKVKFQKIVLPIKIYEDSLTFASNVFTDSAYYGFVNIESYSRFTCNLRRNTDIYYSFPAQIVQLYDSNFFKKNVNCTHQQDIINYAGNTYDFTYLGDLSNATPQFLEKIKGKIVLMGYLGDNYHVPNNFDEIDSHETPHAVMYGVVFWANIIHTLLGHQINHQDFFSTILTYALIVILSNRICNYVIKKRNGYFALKTLQLILIIVLFILTSFLLHRAQILIDYEMAVASVIIVPEFIFWFLKRLGTPRL